jgi:alpha-beta hydrolase superfamily lysophospholipase
VAVTTLAGIFAAAFAQEPAKSKSGDSTATNTAPSKTSTGKATKSITSPKSKAKAKGTRLVPGGPKAKSTRNRVELVPKADPGDAKLKTAMEEGTFHYRVKLEATDGSGTLAAVYYPSRLGTGAAVALLVHEKERSGKDFEDSIAELEGSSLAVHLQKQGIAVLALDLRGQGDNQRRATSAKDWRLMPSDLQTAYIFLLDRHNHGELNLARLVVLGVGEGANLAALWATMPGAATTKMENPIGNANETPPKNDISALILVSPMVDAHALGLSAQRTITTLAAKTPIALLVGERDALSAGLVKAVQQAVKRYRSNLVTFYPSGLHGYKLLKLEPEITKAIVRFIDDTAKARAEVWEPRYNLAPVTYSDVKTLANPKSGKGSATAPKAKDATK